LACGLTLPAWKANRKLAAAIAVELAAFTKRRDEMLERHEGKIVAGTGFEFATDEGGKAFAEEWGPFWNLEILLEGEPVRIDDILSNPPTQADMPLLRAFFVEEQSAAP
jgi:hypothetical protein